MNENKFQPGDTVVVRALKADGSLHRTWRALIEEMEDGHIITYTAVGNVVRQNGQDHFQRYQMRSYYRLGLPYTVVEVFHPDGRLAQLYSDVCSPVKIVDGEFHYIDHELDVIQYVGQEARIIDQDEFAAAAVKYGYSAEFQAECYRIAEEALEVIRRWQPSILPNG